MEEIHGETDEWRLAGIKGQKDCIRISEVTAALQKMNKKA